MQKVLTSMILTTFILSLLLVPTINGDDIPVLPHYFYGYVFDKNGELIQNGTVTAKLGSKIFTTPIKDGAYGYVPITEGFPIKGSNSDADKTIYFYINDTLTGKTAKFQAGGENVDYSLFFNLSFDTTSPVISEVSVSSVSKTQASITWITNEKSNSIVNYGSSVPPLNTKKDSSYVKNHNIIISDLNTDTTYYFEVSSFDISGNTGIDDNSSNYYKFKTKSDTQNGGNGGNGGSTTPPSNDFIPAPPPSDENIENIPPVANAGGPYYSKTNETVTFDASDSTDSDGYIIEYVWDFGDGTGVKTNDVTTDHIYSNVGQFIVILKVIDNNGTSNSIETQVNVTSDDSDNDGWSDEAEQYYGTDPFDPDDFPSDFDGDGIPDEWDADDDNDGLSDVIENKLGTNVTNPEDVIRILNEFGLFYLIDIDGDGKLDRYYNRTKGYVTDLILENGFYLINSNNDNKYEYKYNSLSGEFSEYIKETKSQPNNLILIMGIISLFIIIFLGLIIKWKLK